MGFSIFNAINGALSNQIAGNPWLVALLIVALVMIVLVVMGAPKELLVMSLIILVGLFVDSGYIPGYYKALILIVAGGMIAFIWWRVAGTE